MSEPTFVGPEAAAARVRLLYASWAPEHARVMAYWRSRGRLSPTEAYDALNSYFYLYLAEARELLRGE